MGALLSTPCRRYRGGSRNRPGGHVSHNRRPDGTRHRSGAKVYLHRWVWEQAHGPIAAGLYVRHRCDTPDCFRLDHLELGTHADNMRDAAERGGARNAAMLRDCCPYGHDYDDENTYHRPDRPGHRECRACRRAASARHKAGQ
jgi:hypothetical protein